MRRGILSLAILALTSFSMAASEIHLSVLSPFQSQEMKDSAAGLIVTRLMPLFVMPCKGATKPLHPQEGDVYLVFENVSRRAIDLSLRDSAPVTLTFYTPTGIEQGKKWIALEYSGKTELPANPGLVGMGYELAPGGIRVVVLNLFKIPGIGDRARDWMAVYGTNRMKVECTLRWGDSESPHDLSTGWFPVAVKEPEADPSPAVPKGSDAESVPSIHPGEPPVVIFHSPHNPSAGK
jgi:hypothetical protein